MMAIGDTVRVLPHIGSTYAGREGVVMHIKHHIYGPHSDYIIRFNDDAKLAFYSGEIEPVIPEASTSSPFKRCNRCNNTHTTNTKLLHCTHTVALCCDCKDRKYPDCRSCRFFKEDA